MKSSKTQTSSGDCQGKQRVIVEICIHLLIYDFFFVITRQKKDTVKSLILFFHPCSKMGGKNLGEKLNTKHQNGKNCENPLVGETALNKHSLAYSLYFSLNSP